MQPHALAHGLRHFLFAEFAVPVVIYFVKIPGGIRVQAGQLFAIQKAIAICIRIMKALFCPFAKHLTALLDIAAWRLFP